MNDEFIMFNNEADSYQESYESDESVTLEDVEAYLESLSTDIDEAVMLRDDMIQEEYEYEDLSLEDVETYIESAIDKYNDIVDTVNGIVQEAAEATDDSSVDDFEESARRDISPYDRAHRYREDPRETLKRHEALDRNSIDPTGRYYEIKADKEHIKEDDDLRRKRLKNKVYKDNIDKLPSKEYIKAKELRDFYTDLDKKSYRNSDPDKSTYYKDSIDILNGNMKDIVDAHKARKEADAYSKMTPLARAVNKKYEKFANEYALNDYRDNELDLELEEPLTAQEFFDESYEPDNEPFVPYTDEGIYIEADGPEKHDLTLGGAIVLGAGLGAAIGTGINIINMLITEHKYGRFPHDMKRVYDIVQKADFKASANKRILKKALKAVSKDLHWMFNGIGGRWKVTVNEAAELKKLRKHVDDLYTRGWMLTRNEELSQKRRVPERIAEFIEQGNKVLKILNKSVYKNPAEDVTTEYMV